MSWILRYKKLCALLTGAISLNIFFVLIFRLYSITILLSSLDLFLFIFLFIDYKVYRSLISQMEVFSAKSHIRNVDYLVIGELCEARNYMPSGDSFVQIFNPGTSIFGAFQILKRTHSILREGGTVLFALKKNMLNKKSVGAIDTFFLHEIAIKEYGLENLSKLKKVILFLRPLESMWILFNVKGTNFSEYIGEDLDISLINFCQERNINLKIYVE